MARSIALAMIARDAERSIERALRSAAPFVDRMVVLDTGSVDATPEIARSCGAIVEHFEWIDDFAAAKSAALELADADWNLVLDSDEWIVEGGEALQQLHSDPRRYVGIVRHHNYEDFQQHQLAYAFSTVRVLPAGIRYEYRIHEQPKHDLPAWHSPVILGHDGYEPSLMPAKAQRNLRLLRLQIDRDPSDPYFAFKYGEALRRFGHSNEALSFLAHAFDEGSRDAPWRHSLALSYMGVLADLQRYEESLRIAELLIDEWPNSPDVVFLLGNVCMDYAVAQPSQAEWLLPMIEASFLRCLEIGDRPDLEHSRIGAGSFLAAKNLYAYFASLGEEDRAQEYMTLEARLRRSHQSVHSASMA